MSVLLVSSQNRRAFCASVSSFWLFKLVLENMMKFLLIAAVLVSLDCVFCARIRRDLLANGEFKFPKQCDNAKIPCEYELSWNKTLDNKNMDFIWKAKLDLNQWVGLSWIKEVSLINADVLALSVVSDEKEKDASKQIMAQLILGEMNKDGVIIAESKQPNLKNSQILYDQKNQIVTAHFSRSLAALSSEGIDDLNKCPIWVFLPELGSIVQKPAKKSDMQKAITELHMKLPEGSLFYIMSPKC